MMTRMYRFRKIMASCLWSDAQLLTSMSLEQCCWKKRPRPGTRQWKCWRKSLRIRTARRRLIRRSSLCQTLKINIDTRHLSSSEKWTQFRPDGIKKSAQFDLKNETDRNHLDTNLTSSSAFFPLCLFWSGSNAKIKIDLDTYNLSLRTNEKKNYKRRNFLIPF